MRALHRSVLVALTGFSIICGRSSASLRGQITGGMLNPDIDLPGEPFSYFWHPTDVIGTLYAPAATEVTPEGYLYTGFGELMFFVGNPLEPVNVRIKTLDKGHLPIIQYHLERGGIKYSFTMFASDLGKGLQGMPVNFVEVSLLDESKEPRAAFLSSAYRFAPPINWLDGVPDDRFHQRFDLIPKEYVDGQTKFSSDWKYSFGRNALVRNGRILYLFPTSPDPFQKTLALENTGLRMFHYFTGEIDGNPDLTYVLDAHTPMGVVAYRIPLQPGETRMLIFKMPIVPLPEDAPEAKLVDEADYSNQLQETASFWEQLVAQSPPLRFPEPKVQETLLSDTVFNLLALDKVGDDYIPNVNKFQYHSFFGGGDTDHMLVALDYMGLTQISERAELYSLKMQSPYGDFMSRGDQPGKVSYWENFGNTLWIWGRHYLLTNDVSFVRKVYPSVVRAVEWEMRVTSEDLLGLMPPSSISDDAWLMNAHQTGQDIWTLVGLRNAIAMAEGLGENQDAERFKAEYQRFWKAFEKQLSKQTARTGGYIPPGLDRALGGSDWDNLLTLYPEPLFEPFDSRVTATIHESRRGYAEGVFTYVQPRAVAKEHGGYVFETRPQHQYWQSLDNAENGLVRGDPEDQELAVKDLYAFLLHTTSTNEPQEWGTFPWGDRKAVCMGHNILPDGASSGVLIESMRNMLVREYKNDLYLFSAVSPIWLEPGKTIEVQNAPTAFGPVSAVLRAGPTGWEVKLSNHFWHAPEHVVIVVPWFYEVQQAEANGHRIQVTKGQLVLSSNAAEVSVKGTIKAGTPSMSFEETVQNYKREYQRRYEEFQKYGVVNQ